MSRPLATFTTLAAVSALVLGSLATPAAAQSPGKPIDVGGWTIAMINNKDGSTNCAATFTYDDKSLIGFSLDNADNHMFVVSEPTATMKEGSQVKMTYQIDKNKPFSGTGVAYSPTVLIVPMEGDMDPIYKQFMNGNTLYISLGSKDFEEPLDGSANAISALSSCQDRLPKRAK